MISASAPGKVILFGEHAVVYGEPAVSVAIDKRIKTTLTPSEFFMMDGKKIENIHYGYAHECLSKAWPSGAAQSIAVESDVPRGSGLGSSAALTSALLGALLHGRHAYEEKAAAEMAFEVEYTVQGKASPTDTTTSTHGGGILVAKQQGEGFLWKIAKEEKEWFLHELNVPDFTIVVGHTGVHARTGPLVDKVERFVRSSLVAENAVKEIGEISLEGVKKLKASDITGVGELMNRNHQLLNFLGVGHKSLDKLVKAVKPISYGAKLTGAGGGGSMIALTDKPDEAAKRIEKHGGTPYVVKFSKEGMRIEDLSDQKEKE